MRFFRTALAVLGVVAVVGWAGPALSAEGLFRTTNAGEFGRVDPTTGAFTVLSTPGGDDPVSGLCLDKTTGRLFATRRTTSSITDLIELDPVTGELIGTLATIKNGLADMRITDLACQPQTGVLFGLDNSSPAKLYSIDKVTGAATLRGSTAVERGGLAFHTDGSLLAVSLAKQVAYLSPIDGSTVGMVVVDVDEGTCLDGLGIRPSDGRPFATGCDFSGQLFRINPTTGAADLVGDMGGAGADLEFLPVAEAVGAPAMTHAAMVGLALMLSAAGIVRLRRSRRFNP